MRVGDFELLSELGRGGMGIVYEARQLSLSRRVALKILPPGLGLTDQAVQRFQREARAAARLHHTNIVPVHATGEEAGCHYYAMELIEGQPLSDVLSDLTGQGSSSLMDETLTRLGGDEQDENRAEETTSRPTSGITSLSDSSSGGRRWFDAVARLIAEVADALDYAHERGVIHRDIKPANLMLSKNGRLCVTDFGLARVAQEPGMTVSGSLMGTPAYMSPEQVAARRMKLDHRTDIYSLGAVLYEMLTLRKPFPGESREEILGSILAKEPRKPRRINPRVPLDLETICQKAMEKDPGRRYGSAGELAEDLRQYLQRGLITARRAGPLRRTAKFVRRHPLGATITAAVLVVVLLGSWARHASTQRTIEVARRSVADARYFLSQGEYRKGLESVDAARALAPDLPDARMMRARTLMMLGRHAEAVAEAEALLAANPDDWAAHLVLAAAGPHVPTVQVASHVAAVETHAPDTADAHYLRSLLIESSAEAIVQLDRALALDPGHAAALLARAQRHVDLKDFPAALLDGERLAAIRPRSAQGRRVIAWVHYNLHDPERALAEYERAIELDPGDPLTYLWRAWVHKSPTTYRHIDGLLPSTGKTAEAIADLTRAIEIDPDYAVYHRERADAHYRLGQYENAIGDALRAIELDPNDLAAYNTWGYACLFSERLDEIPEIIEQMTAAFAGWSDRHAIADGLGNIALGHQAVGMMDLAIAGADRMIEVAPDYYQAYFVRQWLRRRVGDVPGAEADLVRAASIELLDPKELILRGSGFSQVGHPELALADFDRSIELAPQWADPYHLRAHLQEASGRLDESLADYDRAISLAPRWAKLYGDRGRVLAATGRHDDALADFETALEIDGQNVDALLNRAEVRLQAGRVELAMVDIDRLIELNPDDPWAHATRARALHLGGRADEALAAIELAMERSPGLWHFYPRRATYLLYGEVDCAAAVADLDRALELAPASWYDVAHVIATIQVTELAVACPREFDPAAALESAKFAAEAAPRDPVIQATLGMALYRAGRFREARDALVRTAERSMPEPEPWELFGLAMAEWESGNGAAARRAFEHGLAREERAVPANPRDSRARNEAAELLGFEP
jgi:tetratricopeptide (TPR) repeat protein